MRRAERNTARLIALTVAGALLFVVGYFAGSRYARPPFEGLSAVVLKDAPELVAPPGADLRKGWQLVAVGQVETPSCARVLARMAQIHNRLASRPALQQALDMRFFTTGPDRGQEARAQVPRIVPLSLEAAHDFAAQLGQPSQHPLDCREAPLGLVDPHGRLRALVGVATDPVTAAADLTRLLDGL